MPLADMIAQIPGVATRPSLWVKEASKEVSPKLPEVRCEPGSKVERIQTRFRASEGRHRVKWSTSRQGGLLPQLVQQEKSDRVVEIGTDGDEVQAW